MAKFSIVAYADEDGNRRQEVDINAKTKDEAWAKAWKMFPAHHEIGVFEIEEG